MDLFLKGLAAGFFVSAPIGPIGIFCIDITLNKGKRDGLIVGVGASAANVVLMFLLGLGLTFFLNFSNDYSEQLKWIDGILLGYLGFRIFLSKASKDSRKFKYKTYFSTFFMAFFYTLINPMAILLFALIFAFLNISHLNHYSILILVAGVFIGSMFWWLALTNFLSIFEHKCNIQTLDKINKIAGSILIFLGLLILLK